MKLKIIGWFLVTFFTVCALGLFSDGSIIGGITLCFLAFMLTPISYNKSVKGKESPPYGYGAHISVLTFFSFCALVYFIPSSDNSEKEASSSPTHENKFAEDQKSLKGAAQGYRIITAKDTSIQNRRRISIQVVPENLLADPGDYAYTVLEAAKSAQIETKAKVVSAYLEMNETTAGKGKWLSMVHYIPDGKGFSGKDETPIWDLMVLTKPVNQKYIDMHSLWEKEKEAFRDSEGLVNEEKLKIHLENKLGIKTGTFTLPLILPEKATYNGGAYEVIGSKNIQSVALPDDPCDKNAGCFMDKIYPVLATKCQRVIEKIAKYDYEWTDGVFEMKFSRAGWKEQDKKIINIAGDKIKLQNGFGAWQNYIYVCTYDAVNETVLDVKAEPGRF